MEGLIITESAKSGKERKYTCPYCEERNTKTKLVDHIERAHKSLIPKDYTAARLVFNIANKKDHGTCVCGCGKETAWREDLWRYDRYADKACKDKYSKEMKQRMMKVYGKYHLLNDVEQQNKMLANRSISGTYKFTTGGSIPYVGSFEMKFLEFCDKVMNYKWYDIEQPGPVIEYTWNKQKHLWITDYYIPSANLVLDIKDGGDNPNTRSMEDYRDKQIAKENAIRKEGKYNYLRLTNNNFAQLMLVLSQIKSRMIEAGVESKEYSPIIKINESTFGCYTNPTSFEVTNKDAFIKYMIECMVGVTSNGVRFNDSSVYVVQTKDNDFNDDYYLSNNIELDYLLSTDKNGEIKLNTKSVLKDKKYKVYEFTGIRNKSYDNPKSVFELVTGTKILESGQLDYDDRFRLIPIVDEAIKEECITSTIMGSNNPVPVITNISLNEINISSYSDNNGIYIENNLTGLRSKSFSSEKLITEEVIEYIRKGEI